MRVLLDTHLLVWTLTNPRRLSATAIELMRDGSVEKLFSAASIWEVAIKAALRKTGFDIDPFHLASTARLDFEEAVVTSRAAARVGSLPLIHRDPFDRLLVAQALEEGATLLTADRALLAYGSHVQLAA